MEVNERRSREEGEVLKGRTNGEGGE